MYRGCSDAYAGLAAAVGMNDLISEELTQMVANITSTASGCRYCQAHTVAHAEHIGVEPAKLADLWSFETSAHFNDAERLPRADLAMHAGQHPNAVTETDFEECRRCYYTDDQITAIIAVCAMFGFLNRWNDTMAHTLEDRPREVAGRVSSPKAGSRAYINDHSPPDHGALYQLHFSPHRYACSPISCVAKDEHRPRSSTSEHADSV